MQSQHRWPLERWVVLENPKEDKSYISTGNEDYKDKEVNVVRGVRLTGSMHPDRSRHQRTYRLDYWNVKRYNSFKDMLAEHFEKFL